jgi:acyl-CoA thioesterase FadM
MNLYLRLIFCLLRSWRSPRFAVGQTLERQFRVLPNDIDINGHMNNGRYLTMLDLMIVEYFIRVGLASAVIKKGWRPMSGGSVVSYRRGLKPLQSYTLRFRIDACDTQWNYMRFEFFDGQKVCAMGYMKGAVVGKKGFISNAESYAAIGQPVYAAAMPSAVQHWIDAEKAMVAAPW